MKSKKRFTALRSFKALGPYSFQALLFQNYWALVWDTICELVPHVLRGACLPKGLDGTFLTYTKGARSLVCVLIMGYIT